MTWWEALVLGVVQGLTEFFPVSSSGHLVMGQDIMGLQIPGILFDIVVHVATLVSVCIVYRAKLAQLILGALGRTEESSWPYILKIVVATLPAVVVGFTLKDWFEARFDDAEFAATMVLVTGCVVWSSRWATGIARLSPLELAPVAVAGAISAAAGTWLPFLAVLALQTLLMSVSRLTAPREMHMEPTWSGALLMGIGQALAIFPGITRSGTTVLTGPLAPHRSRGGGGVQLPDVHPRHPRRGRAPGSGRAAGGGDGGVARGAGRRLPGRRGLGDRGHPLLRRAPQAAELPRIRVLHVGRCRRLPLLRAHRRLTRPRERLHFPAARALQHRRSHGRQP
jgi:undecaprenyl pyrophosphate phosphatase UppP